MTYRQHIAALAPGHDPRHVEAFIRCEHGSLGALSADEFKAEVEIAIRCIREGGMPMAEKLAQSFGL
jgi:hypothetical protein